MNTKRCAQCRKVKPLSAFRLEPRAADKHRYSCLDCDRKRYRRYHQTHRAQRNAAALARRKANPERDRLYAATYRRKFPWRTLLMHAKKRAAKFGWTYDLDKHLPAIQKRVSAMRCEITGVPLVNGSGCGGTGKRYYNTISLDRIDPAKGYLYSNIRIVCWAMNCAMGTWGELVLRDIVATWLTRR